MSYKQALQQQNMEFRGDADEIYIKNCLEALTEDQIEEFLATEEVMQFFSELERECPSDKCDLQMEIASMESQHHKKLLSLLRD